MPNFGKKKKNSPQKTPHSVGISYFTFNILPLLVLTLSKILIFYRIGELKMIYHKEIYLKCYKNGYRGSFLTQ